MMAVTGGNSSPLRTTTSIGHQQKTVTVTWLGYTFFFLGSHAGSRREYRGRPIYRNTCVKADLDTVSVK